jgi:hypothetical protein
VKLTKIKELKMLKVAEIQTEIESLSEEEYTRLRIWFSERDWEKWDKQIELDSESGNLDFLIKEALDEKVRGKLKEL